MNEKERSWKVKTKEKTIRALQFRREWGGLDHEQSRREDLAGVIRVNIAAEQSQSNNEC